jgi:CRP/FNR family transcriptional regulator, cyclic AMP receptor protein
VIDDPPGEDQLLAEVDVLKGLPEREVNCLAARSSIVRLGENETLALGENLRGILLLVSGRVRVHGPDFGGQDLTFSVVEGGTLVGQSGPTPGASRALLVEALEASVLRAVEREDFERLVLRNPEVGLNTIRLLGERLDAYEVRLSDLIRKEVPARLAGLLLRLSEHQRVVTDEDGRRAIRARYTHRQLASMVGSNREAVTRALGMLRKAGAVKTRDRRIYVTDAAALEYFAEVER